jgi:hypothetical protein
MTSAPLNPGRCNCDEDCQYYGRGLQCQTFGWDRPGFCSTMPRYEAPVGYVYNNMSPLAMFPAPKLSQNERRLLRQQWGEFT